MRYVFRGNGKISLKKNGHIKQGDLIETLRNGHAWLSLIDGTLIRMSPNSTFSIESFEISPSNILFFHRINNGNVNFISRDESSDAPLSVVESDRVFYPFFDFHELGDFLRFSNKNQYSARSFHYEKYRMLNFLKDNNLGVLKRKKVEHVINTPYLIIDFKKAKIEFVVDWRGNDYIKVKQINESGVFYKKNIEQLEKFEFEKKNTWYSVDLTGVREDPTSSNYWYGDFAISDIPSVKIISEIFLPIMRDYFIPQILT